MRIPEMKEDVAVAERVRVISASHKEQSAVTIGLRSFKTRLVVLLLSCIFILTFLGLTYDKVPLAWQWLVTNVPEHFLVFLLAGFVAQLVDGALGMAYGISASSILLSFGVSPAAASASIHASEIFTSGASGLMHLKFQNVNKKLFKSLLLPGVIGAALGALVLSSLEDYNYLIKPVVAFYTLCLGFVIIRKAFRKSNTKIDPNNIPKLAAFGGFMDSIGGGGWGPIVSSTLIAGGRHPRYTIGSVNLTEFFVALASSLTFFIMIGITHWSIIAGLIMGGVIAAPLGALLARRLPVKGMMIVVGALVMLISIRILLIAFL